MPVVIPVKFRFNAHTLWFDPRQTEAIGGDYLICQTAGGLAIGVATADSFYVDEDELAQTLGECELQPVIRLADVDDRALAAKLAKMGDEALPVFRRCVKEEGLDMKPVGVEYLFDQSKVVCYFSSDNRVDFRQLVKVLSKELHQRIDMRQIGVREEAAFVGGFGHCGQELCCRRFGCAFEPVSIRMAKEQDLPLNSSKISGACGRLMCCLRYEFEAYRDFKQRAPKRNALIHTPLGEARITDYDTPKEELGLRLENAKVIHVPLADMSCSDEAVDKSKKLGCPCRPDTVSRSVLDRLQSPDVQMALAELDRQNGILPADDFEEDDLFVQQKKPQHSQTTHGDSSDKKVQPHSDRSLKNADKTHDKKSKLQRHRRRRTMVPKTDDAESFIQAPEPKHRRRHIRTSSHAYEKQQKNMDKRINTTPKEQSFQKRVVRRRHTKASD